MPRNQLATAAQLRALLESYTESDSSRFLSVATQIAAHAARAGDEVLAVELRKLVEEAKRRDALRSVSPGSIIPMARPTGDLAGLVAATYPKTRLSDMVLTKPVLGRLRRVVREYRHSEQLEMRGLHPRRKLLLVGPPGCGKSMTAAAISGELGRPLLQVQLHALIAKFMGETAAKLHLVFQAMEKAPGVYLFDEFDALGAHRGADNDVGEARRILNSFLIFLEQDASRSIIIAATNVPDMLDRALFRRFDDVITYQRPASGMIESLMRNRLAGFDISAVIWDKVLGAAGGLSHGEVVRACEDAAKDAVLSGKERILTTALVKALRARAGHKSNKHK
jgi:SpoVK/Ycf46/Vps4 family AAA+-type ATPase